MNDGKLTGLELKDERNKTIQKYFRPLRADLLFSAFGEDLIDDLNNMTWSVTIADFSQ